MELYTQQITLEKSCRSPSMTQRPHYSYFLGVDIIKHDHYLTLWSQLLLHYIIPTERQPYLHKGSQKPLDTSKSCQKNSNTNMDFTMLLGYRQLWRTSNKLHWVYLTDFSSVRSSWCDVDSVLMQCGAFVQLLVRWHNRNLQNSLKKIRSVQHKIELVCYSTGFLTGWENRPAFKHSVIQHCSPCDKSQERPVTESEAGRKFLFLKGILLSFRHTPRADCEY